MRIAVTEDSLAQQALFRSVLDGVDDLSLTFFKDGLEAYRALLEDPPDLLITDILLPGLEGLALVRLLKFQPRFRELPVLVSSSVTDSDINEQVRRAGGNAFLPKPFGEDELTEAIAILTGEQTADKAPERLVLF